MHLPQWFSCLSRRKVGGHVAFNFLPPVRPAIVQRIAILLGGLIWASLSVFAQDNQAQPSWESQQIAWLRSQLAAQQAQIEQLRKELQEQRALLHAHSNVGTPASSPTASPEPLLASAGPPAAPAPAIPVQAVSASTPPRTSQILSGPVPEPAPLSFSIGSTRITPVGFMDFTAVFRSKNVGSGLGTSFGTVPFANSVNGNLSEYRLSAQNSRLGARLDSHVRGFDVLGYWRPTFWDSLLATRR